MFLLIVASVALALVAGVTIEQRIINALSAAEERLHERINSLKERV